MRAPFAWRRVAPAALIQLAALAATSDRYGYHRDELYFRLLRPGWGYLDQPPLTPLLARATRLIADQPWALRIPAMLASVAAVVLVALIAREAGGGRTAQSLAAWGYGFATFPLIVGHVLLTASIDQPVWLGVLLLAVRAQLREDARAWWWAGALAGAGLYNKLLIVVLVAALVAGVLITGPRRLLVSRPVLVAAAIAIVVGLPNLVYQVVNGFPQLEFGRQLAAHNGGSVRASALPLAILLLGPPLVAVWVAGLVALCRRPSWRPIRFLAPALGVLVVLVLVMGSQPYYEFGLLAAVFALGCVPAEGWLARGGRARVGVVVALGGVNAAVSLVLALPLVPVGSVGSTPVPGINQTARDSIGWPAYVREVARVWRALPAHQRSAGALVASNYGEAGALARFGGTYGLPHVYSAQNQLYFQGRPPASADTMVLVGGQADTARSLFASCRTAGHLDNGVGVDNEEQDEPIVVCRGPVGGWRVVWPRLKHED